MANTFSITNNHALRMIYVGNTDVVKKQDRENQSALKLNHADSKALKNGLAKLAETDMDSIEKNNKVQKERFYNQVKAFADAYNYTLESGTASGNESIAALTRQMKKVSSSHAGELKDYGISFDSSGYMKIKESAVKNMSSSNYTDLIGKDSKYNKELSKIATRMSRHVDITL